MSDELPSVAPVWRKPLLCIVGIGLVMCMLSLGWWQLDRADQKRELVRQLESRAQQASVPLSSLALDSDSDVEGLRFRQVLLNGRYLTESDIFVDNQVVNGQVGYQVFTPFQIANSELLVMVGRGWVSVGQSREVVPDIATSPAQVTLKGRLNKAPAKPPLWNDKYSVADGSVWQYLPISDVANVLAAQVFPLVVELAPDAGDNNGLVRKWPQISDQWVAKHQGYAFQWFAMAAAFFIACLVLLFRGSFKKR